MHFEDNTLRLQDYLVNKNCIKDGRKHKNPPGTSVYKWSLVWQDMLGPGLAIGAGEENGEKVYALNQVHYDWRWVYGTREKTKGFAFL